MNKKILLKNLFIKNESTNTSAKFTLKLRCRKNY